MKKTPADQMRVLMEAQDIGESPIKSLRYATKSHAGQSRSDGSAYIEHPKRVARLLRQHKTSKNLSQLIQAAYLHDTIEDTDTTHDDLHKMFGGLVASLVQELTSDKEEISKIGKTEYLSQKMAKMTSYALAIKLADRLDNVRDITTAKTPEWRIRYRAETLGILKRLESDRVLSASHRKLIASIKTKLDEIDH